MAPKDRVPLICEKVYTMRREVTLSHPFELQVCAHRRSDRSRIWTVARTVVSSQLELFGNSCNAQEPVQASEAETNVVKAIKRNRSGLWRPAQTTRNIGTANAANGAYLKEV